MGALRIKNIVHNLQILQRPRHNRIWPRCICRLIPCTRPRSTCWLTLCCRAALCASLLQELEHLLHHLLKPVAALFHLRVGEQLPIEPKLPCGELCQPPRSAPHKFVRQLLSGPEMLSLSYHQCNYSRCFSLLEQLLSSNPLKYIIRRCHSRLCCRDGRAGERSHRTRKGIGKQFEKRIELVSAEERFYLAKHRALERNII